MDCVKKNGPNHLWFCLLGPLELCVVADLEEIGLPRFAIEQIMIHSGKAVPVLGGVEHEPMPEVM